MSAHGARFLVGLLIATSTCMSRSLNSPGISFTALETLLDLDASFTITSLEDNAVPVYRKGLQNDYVAYWQIVVNDKDFVIVSAGPETGDYRVIYEGHLPTFTSRLDAESGQRCTKYFMIAPDARIICEDAKRKVVGIGQLMGLWTDAQRKALGHIDKLTGVIQSGLHELEEEFRIREEEVRNESIWVDVNSETSAVELSVGETVKLPVSASAEVVAVEGSSQNEVCAVTGLCVSNDKTVIRNDSIKTTCYGARYVEFDIARLNGDTGKSVSFLVIGDQGNGDKITRRYVTSPDLRRSRRLESSTSIPHEDDFPDYDQFDNGGCAVGCGPVAWASVLGYLDRLSHRYSAKSDWKKLYRGGTNGMTGSIDTVAPLTADNRMKNYIKQLNTLLRTRCLFGNGATFSSTMGRISSYYSAQVTNGTVEIARGSFTTLVGIYRVRYRDNAIRIIAAGYPVIIGWKVNGRTFKQHYPIVTKYKWTERRVRLCALLYCTTLNRREHKFYMHMGWGGTDNGWYTAEAFMTAAVTN